MMELRKEILKNITRVVIKIGTSVLADGDGRLDSEKISSIVSQLCSISNKGVDAVLVSSGAVGAGMGILGLKARPASISKQQAAAAIGQIQLMKLYDDFFRVNNRTAAQVLLTQDDFSNRKRYVNAKHTLFTILDYKAVPIINENDTVSIDEIKFGDNDRLSSLVCNMIGAQFLIMLSDVDGLLGRSGEVINIVEKITPDIEKLAKGTNKEISLGGMITKLQAAKVVSAGGSACVIANGRIPDIIVKVLNGDNNGTLFLPSARKMPSKKSWIAFGLKAKAKIFVDKGARKAITGAGRSLLASGITGRTGDFQKGDVVGIAVDRGKDFAKGIANYSAGQIDKIKGLKTSQIELALGCKKACDEVIHRDNLVLL